MRVKGEGPKKCTMALIGEAWGETEEIMKQPFVGASGQLLNTKLHNVGVARQDCYLTNIINARPANNNFEIFWQDKEHRHPTAHLLSARDSLLEELDELDTNIFVPLGSNALWALTSKTSISKWRGSILSTQLPSGRKVKVIGTYHPASALREFSLSHIIETDLKRAKGDSSFFDLALPERNLQIAPTLNDLLVYAGQALGKPDVAFDIECTPEYITCLSLSVDPSHSISIPTTKGYWGSASLLKTVLEIVNNILVQPEVHKVGQNITFDIQFIMRFMGILPKKPWEDTMIMQHSLFAELPKGLDFLCSVYTREPYYKDDLKVWSNTGQTDHEMLWRYNALDSAVTLECCHVMRKEMAEFGVTGIYKFMMELLEPLLYMMMRGVKFDRVAADKHEVDYSKLLADAEEAFANQYGEVNANSPKQVLALLDRLGIPPILKKNAKGIMAPTTNKKAIDKLSAKSPELMKLVTIRENKKLIHDYLNVALDGVDKRFRCSYNSTGAETGRLSSSESVFGCGTNGQNFPIKVRDVWTVDEDDLVFTGADLAGAESRVVAFESGDPVTIGLFERGENIHKYTAAHIVFHCTEEAVMEDKARLEALGRDTDTMYFRAKKLRHSLEKRGSWKTIQDQLGIPASEAKAFVQNFEQGSPMFMKWVRDLGAQLRRDRTIVSPTGRKRVFLGRLYPETAFNETLKEAVAHIPQDVISYVINSILNGFYYNECKDKLNFPRTEVMLQIHDAIYIQHPASITKQVHEALNKYAEKLIFKAHGREYYIPLDIKTGKNCRDLEKVKYEKV